jgi:hypothetical protein
LNRARDRRGAKRPRRNAPGPEAKPEPWQPPVALIARSPPEAGMRPAYYNDGQTLS